MRRLQRTVMGALWELQVFALLGEGNMEAETGSGQKSQESLGAFTAQW